ncbi:hypothetical protein ACTFBT_21250 [Streptomyces microflavus]|nr:MULTISPECIES: hypothetical protein [Streptomyces]MDX2980954.1 hypothetical protein [Streptomyces sp. NRRL_B-2249]WSA62137.1 hypothetical protein OHB31_19175 [Streptomyces microflavus]GGX72581.1 hypothetical protein GCM10010298_41380 [Streptomyces microflavus]
MNMQGAAERADQILDGVLAEVQPDVRWVHGPTTTGNCTVTRRRTVMTVISAQRRGSLLGVVDRYWRNSGYRMRTVNNHVDAPAMYAETKDGFAVSLIVADKGQVHFDVNSPCVSYSEVADSPRQATAPLDPEAEVIPRPNIHSDFWSAQTPEVGVTVGGD